MRMVATRDLSHGEERDYSKVLKAYSKGFFIFFYEPQNFFDMNGYICISFYAIFRLININEEWDDT
jgi:hypothetical protein